MKNEFIKRTAVLASVLGLNLVLALSVPAFALEEKNQNMSRELPQTGPTELFFTTFGLIMITIAVIYWYRSTQFLSQQKTAKVLSENRQNDLNSNTMELELVNDSNKK